jgi:hypothetical protein
LILGFKTDGSSLNSYVLIPYSVRGSQTVTSPLTGQVSYDEGVIHYGKVRARLGYAFDHFLLYAQKLITVTSACQSRIITPQFDVSSLNPNLIALHSAWT